MSSGNHLVHPNDAIQTQHWGRRDFVKGLAALAGAAGLSAYDMRSGAAEPPPETNKIRIHGSAVTCIAPEIVAQELLYAEGFTDVLYVNYPKDTKLWPPESFHFRQLTFDFSMKGRRLRSWRRPTPVA
jgi:hypothetical protein